MNKGEKCIICGESNPYFPKVDLHGGKAGRNSTAGQKGSVQMGKNHLDVVPNMFRPERQKISGHDGVKNFEKSLNTYENSTKKGTNDQPVKKFILSRTAPIAVIDAPDSGMTDFEESEPFSQERSRGLKKWLIGATVILVACLVIGFGFCKEHKYKKALTLFEDGNYVQARAEFEELADYKDSGKYLLLADARLSKVENIEVLYDLIDFEDTKEILLSDEYIIKFLTGKWADSLGKRIEFIKEGDGVKLICTLPFENGGRYRLTDGTQYHGNDETGWEKSFSYEIVTENKIKVYCYKDGKTYIMYRQ
ncbi:MAG: hypothetical protein IJN96_07555 [Clostridia bacterium]|nr:hypothetical protein [Clostridia bacterium]